MPNQHLIKINELTKTPFLQENIEEFQNTLSELYEQDKISDITSEEFKEAINTANTIFNNKQLDPQWCILTAVHMGFQLYNRTIPTSGLSVDNPHIKGCIDWVKNVIEMKAPDSSTCTQAKVKQAAWLAALYQRRNMIKEACDYSDLTVKLVMESRFACYLDTSSILNEAVNLRYGMLPDGANMDDPIAQSLMTVLKKEIAFHKNVPIEKRTNAAYIRPAHALLQLKEISLMEKLTKLNDGVSSLEEVQRQALVDKLKDQLKKLKLEKAALNISDPPIQMWDNEERWHAERHYLYGMVFLGKLYAELGNNVEAAKQLLAAHKTGNRYRNSSDLYSLLNKPEIHDEVLKIEPKFKVPKFYGSYQIYEPESPQVSNVKPKPAKSSKEEKPEVNKSHPFLDPMARIFSIFKQPEKKQENELENLSQQVFKKES